jgi:cephalosporin-C deacetylase
LAVESQRVEVPLKTVEVHDLSFAGYGGHRIKAWLILPAEATGPLPGVVQYSGYGGGRGNPIDDLAWASSGYAQLVMDVRGQANSETDDPDGSGPQVPGFFTKGIGSRETYYYRRVFTDAVRAVDALRSLPQVDAGRIGVTGPSQGGAITVAVAGLLRDEIQAAAPFVPALSDVFGQVTKSSAGAHSEIASYLSIRRSEVDRVFTTLSYFDGVNFARRATAPAWYSVGLGDDTCMPSTVFASFNVYGGPKQITVWRFNGHEAGKSEDELIALRAFGTILNP